MKKEGRKRPLHTLIARFLVILTCEIITFRFLVFSDLALGFRTLLIVLFGILAVVIFIKAKPFGLSPDDGDDFPWLP